MFQVNNDQLKCLHELFSEEFIHNLQLQKRSSKIYICFQFSFSVTVTVNKILFILRI